MGEFFQIFWPSHQVQSWLYLTSLDDFFRHQVGPGYYERWTKWNSRTEEESKKAAILSELERLLLSDDDHRHSDPKLIILFGNSAILY